MATAISAGGTVRWNTSQGRTTGTAVEERVKELTVDGRTFKASEDEPHWIVESSKTGARAAHKESTLSAG